MSPGVATEFELLVTIPPGRAHPFARSIGRDTRLNAAYNIILIITINN